MENRYIGLTTDSSVFVDGYIWFSNSKYNGLFKMDCDSKAVEFVSLFPEARAFQSALHRKCVYIRDCKKIAFLPWLSDWLHLYDLNSGSINSIYINRKGKESVSGGLYYDGCIYLFPVYNDQDLCVVNLTDNSVEVDISFRNQCKEFFEPTDRNPLCVVHDYARFDDKIWFSVVGTSDLYNWNYKTKKLNVEHVDIQSIYTVSSIENGILISSTDIPSVWKYASSALEEMVIGNDNVKEDSETFNTGFFSGIISSRGKIYLLSDVLKKYICISDNVCEELKFEGETYFANRIDYERTLVEISDEIFMLPQKGDRNLLVLKTNSNGEKLEAFSMNCDEEYLKRIKSEQLGESIMARESESITLYDFINLLT